MLATSLLMTVTGFALMYAGVKGGDLWRQPWKPFMDALGAGGGSDVPELPPGTNATSGRPEDAIPDADYYSGPLYPSGKPSA